MNEWISVKDRLPIDSEKIIFYVPDVGQCFSGIFAEIWVRFDEIHQNSFIENLECHLFENEEVTHWMPLPEMPNE